MNDRGIIASYLISPLSKITDPENTSQFKLVKSSILKRVNDLLIHNTIPITLYNNLLTFRETSKTFELKEDLFKKTTFKNFNVDLAGLLDKKPMYDFSEELNFDVKSMGNKSTGDRTLIKFFKLPGLLVSTSGNSNLIFLSSDPKELCDKLKILIQEGKAGNKSDVIIQENFAKVDKSIENKCICKEQRQHFLIKCNLLHK